MKLICTLENDTSQRRATTQHLTITLQRELCLPVFRANDNIDETQNGRTQNVTSDLHSTIERKQVRLTSD